MVVDLPMRLSRRYSGVAVGSAVVLALLAYPKALAPIGHAYVYLCAQAPAGWSLVHGHPPLLAGFLALLLVAVSVVLLSNLAREVVARRRLEQGVLGIQELGSVRARLIADSRPFAFTAGFLRPHVYVSATTLSLLAVDELDAVLVHEMEHVRRRDPLRFFMSGLLVRLAPLFPLLRTFHLWVQSRAEIAADARALRIHPPSTLAGALIKMAAGPTGAGSPVVAAFTPMTVRIAMLRGEQPQMAVPWPDAAATFVSLAVIVSLIAVLATQSLANTPACTLCPAF